jgi:hypothetical protein
VTSSAEDHPARRRAGGDERPGIIAWRRLMPSWPLLVGLAVFGRLLVERMALLNDPDTYMHIAAGRWMLAHRAMPLHDPFSHSMAGATWQSSEWLAQIVLAAAYDTMGWGGVIALTAACAALAMAALTRFLLRRLDPLPALIGALAAAALIQPHALARPHMLALPLLVLWAGRLLAARDAGGRPPFGALWVMLLWANLHASFLFGLALAGFLAGEAVLQPGCARSRQAEARLWGLFILAALAAALLTPLGGAGLLQPVRLMRMPALQHAFAEWRSPDFQQSPALEAWLLGLLLLGFAVGARLPCTRLLLLLGLVHMTLQHARHGDVLAAVAPLTLAAPLGRRLAELTAGRSPSPLLGWFAGPPRPAGLPAIAAGLLTAAVLAAPMALQPVSRGNDAVSPAAALAEAQRLGLADPVWNAEMFGGYLLFRGVPVFIDGRVEMYGNEFLAKAYRAEAGDSAALDALLSRYRIGWTLLAPGSGAVGILDHLPGWQRVYADGRAVIHRRTGR